MSSLFGQIFKQAKLTFDQKNLSNIKTNFSLLKEMVDHVSTVDLNVDPELFTKRAFSTPEKAPCTYIHIYESDIIAMSVFVLAENYTMPLHDHPMMHGILRCISGHLKIQSYTALTNQIFPVSVNNISHHFPDHHKNTSYIKPQILVRMEPVKECTINTESAFLTPTTGNYHEITAIGGPAAFFDILSPPYDANIPIYGRRKCNFYQKIIQPGTSDILLEKIPSPLHYFCDSAFYNPPDFLLNDHDDK